MIDLDKIDVTKFLPHRPPFLLIDKFLILNDEEVTSSFKIVKDNIFVVNNFFTEMGLVENAAQTCSSIVGKSFFEDDDVEGEGANLIGFISGIKKINVFSCPRVGSTIISDAKLTSRFDTDSYSICSLESKTYLGKEQLLYCVINLIIQDLK